MKLHASVGADILSAIDFPYPVVPIVRHHHENWDGSGYPAGIRGTEIPIGARILAVVDCFDALTSDRPYRPRMSDQDALMILRERRGTMYDPMIVDTFFQVHPTTLTEIPRQGPPSEVLNTIARSRQGTSVSQRGTVVDEIPSSADELLTVYELTKALAGQVGLADAGNVTAKHLRRLIPSSLCVLYVYDRQTDELEARHAVGEGELHSTWAENAIGSAAQRLGRCESQDYRKFRREAGSCRGGEIAVAKIEELYQHTANF